MRLMKIAALASLALAMSGPAVAEDLLSCRITYKLTGWSFVYKQYRGQGIVTCNSGQRINVSIVTHSGGFTIGKSEIEGGGIFSGIKSVNEIYGSFLALDGHVGMTKSVDAQVMTKGEVSLALSGKGRGVDIGVTLGAFIISPR